MRTAYDTDTFTRAYIECALWAENDQSTPQGGEPFDANYSIEDIAPEALARMEEDCRRFQQEQSILLRCAIGNPGYTLSMAGHDFWLNRNGHGAGFWDRGLGIAGDLLSEAARATGGCDLELGDDGRIYIL